MADHVFDAAAFRKMFPAFASDMKYPDEQLSGYFTMAGCYIYPHDWFGMNGDCLQLALNLMTAHLAWSNQMLLAGQTAVGVMTGASIDKVSVSLQAPPSTDAWSFWLSTTPYGLQLWALLRTKRRTGQVIGGLPERDAFRNVYGIQGSGRRRWLR